MAQSLPAGLVSDEPLLALPPVLGVDSLGDSDAFSLEMLGSDLGQDILLLGAPAGVSLEGGTDSIEALLDASQQQGSVIEFLQSSDNGGAALAPQVLTIDLRDGAANEPVRDQNTPCNDMDNDGVCDNQDACPETPAQYPVFSSGCHLAPDKPLHLLGVNFAPRSALLTASSGRVLKQAASLLKRQASLQIKVLVLVASADERKIGQQRASAVREFLIAEGVRSERLSTGVEIDNTESNGVKPDQARVELRAIKKPAS